MNSHPNSNRRQPKRSLAYKTAQVGSFHSLPPRPPSSLTTTNNDKIKHAVKHCVKIRTQRSYREANQSVILTGTDLLEELAPAGHIDIATLFHIKTHPPPSFLSSTSSRIIAVSEQVMSKITGLESVHPSTLAAEISLPEDADFLKPTSTTTTKRLLVLERCQDPGNVGTLLRTALALGWDGVLALPGCADRFNDKAIRASRGACFKVPFASVDSLDEFEEIVRTNNLIALAADVAATHSTSSGITTSTDNNDTEHIDSSSSNGVCLVLGSEGQGVSDEVVERCAAVVSIPLLGDMESLNVASAGAILMYVLSGNTRALESSLIRILRRSDGGGGK